MMPTNWTMQTRVPKNPGLKGNTRLAFCVVRKGEKPFNLGFCSLEGNTLKESANTQRFFLVLL